MLAYEPMLLIAVMGLYLVAGTAIGPTPAAPAVLDTGKATTILACPPGDTNRLSASNQAASVSSAPVPASNTVASNSTVAAGCGATPCCQEAGLPACGTPASKTRAQADRNFKVATILHNARQGGMGWRMLLNLSGIFLGFLFILTIKLRKSPFDLSTSHHGHQEVVKGLTTEFSGKTLAWIEIGHWYENILLMGFVWLFFSGLHPAVAAALVAAVYFLEILVDNASARLKWQTMVKAAWIVTLVLGVSNLLFLFYFNR
ncbi:MAG: NADH-quinone oxidoreductase subunit H [Spirochaetes bacterium]|nr:NADH-quinone oxidoreductase subunit H [Spirochaetota bacterium]